MIRAQHKSVVIPLRIPSELVEKIDEAVDLLKYKSRNQFMRKALEQHTDRTLNAKILEVRDVSTDEATRLIDQYLSKNPGIHYVSQIAEAIGLELRTAFKATQKLIEQKQVRVKRE